MLLWQEKWELQHCVQGNPAACGVLEMDLLIHPFGIQRRPFLQGEIC